MTPDDRIARLEALLARVRSRSRAPRDPSAPSELRDDLGGTNGASRTTTPGLAAYVEATAVVGRSGWSDVPSAPNVWEAEPAPVPDANDAAGSGDAIEAGDANDERTLQEHPVAESFQAARGGMRAPEPSQTRVIDPPPMEVIELDIDPDPSVLPSGIEAASEEPFESRSRLVAAPAALVEPGIIEKAILDDELPGMAREGDAAVIVAASKEPPRDLGLPEVEEIDEPAPSSSRRPISVEEKLKQLAEDDGAIHAAPPESGKLLAAPILNLDEPDVAGARRGHEERPATSGAVRAQAAGAGLAEVARATLEESDVAVFSGRAGEVRAATFGELLDATMKL